MARTRTGYFKQLRELEIWHEMAVAPDVDETTEHLLKRLKLRLAKWSSEGLSYRFKVENDGVTVQRIPSGQRARYADWWALELGEALVLKEKPVEGDMKRAQAAENFMNIIRRERANERDRERGASYAEIAAKPENVWTVGRDSKGRIVAVRSVKDNKASKATAWSPVAVKEPWDGDWL